MLKSVAVAGAFDNLRSPDVRLLQEASRLGPVTVFLASDRRVFQETGQAPRFPWAERLYLVNALRFVSAVVPLEEGDPSTLPLSAQPSPEIWVDTVGAHNAARSEFCRAHRIDYTPLKPEQLAGFPEETLLPSAAGRKKVIVTGCYDWLHSGHVRFFEEVSTYGDLYVVVGHDANIRLLKGEGHPLQPQEERRYMTGAIRFVTQSLVSSGNGWLDAEPEILKIKPDIYAVNEDGDRGGKREYCARTGLEYLVLRRIPAAGLPRRSSTELRGF